MMIDFEAIRCEEGRSIQDTEEVQKGFSEPGQVGSSYQGAEVYLQTTERRKNAIDHFKDLSLSERVFSRNVCNLHKHLYLAIFKL